MNQARLVGLAFGILLIAGAFALVLWQGTTMPITNVALAQGGATATPTAAATTTPSTVPSQQQQSQAIGDTFWSILAGKLNVNVDTLKTQAVEARRQMIDQAVTDGRITQDQANALKEKITSNNIIAPIPLPRTAQGGTLPNQPGPRGLIPRFGNRTLPVLPFGGGAFGHGGLFGLQDLEAVATALKLEPKALIEQLSQGKSLADIAQAQGVDQSVVKQAIIDARTAEIDRLLSLGLISEVQANQLKSQLTPDSIDLSQPWFRFRVTPGQQKSSDLLPDWDGEFQVFGMFPEQFQGLFEGIQGAPNFQFNLDGGDVQTQ